MDQDGSPRSVGGRGAQGRKDGHGAGEDEVPEANLQVINSQHNLVLVILFFKNNPRDLYNWPEKRQIARDTLERNRDSMMSDSVKTIEKILKLDEKNTGTTATSENIGHIALNLCLVLILSRGF